MKWNPDFEIAAFLVEIVFLSFYYARKHIPTKQNRYFVLSLIMAFFVTAFDLLSAYVDSYYTKFPMALVHIVNVVFFISASALSVSLFLYILSLSKQLAILKTPLFAVYCIPFVATELMALSSPFTGFFYYFDAVSGYMHGQGYLINFAFNAFYILLAFCYIAVYRNNISTLQRRGIYAFMICIVAGAILQSCFFRWILLTNAVTCFAIMIVYMSLQNPDLYIDKPTELFNMDAFYEMMPEVISSGRPYACFGICIDNLRAMQSIYGNEEVDHALAAAGKYIKKTSSDAYVFRKGQERFIFVDRACIDQEEFEKKLRERFAAPWISNSPRIIFSLTITYLPYWQIENNAKDIDDILCFSIDEALKKGSGSTLHIDEVIVSRMKRDIAVESAIEKTIEKNSIQVYYQPIYSTATGLLDEAEALARLFDDEIGFIPPDEFIAKAEQNGTIITLGRQIFEKVCQFIRDNDISQYGVKKIGVNLSAVQCMQTELSEELIEMAEKYRVSLSGIYLETTETATIGNRKTMKDNMDIMIKHGASYALDDYGTGYSNLVNILQFPFDVVKIDKSLVWTYFENENNILPDVIEMFKNQKLMITVEGVETKQMAQRLTVMGCDYLQGFYFSKPIPSQDYLRYMRSHREHEEI